MKRLFFHGRSPVLLAGALVTGPAFGATRTVGPGMQYAKPCAAFSAASDGDEIQIAAAGNGTYDGDVCAITKSGLTIRGTGGRARIDAAGQSAQGKGIWVVQGNDTTIENVELSGAEVPDLNGAGIRAEGTNLTIKSCYFHDDQDGILGGAGEVLITNSEFAKNGNCINPAGCAHNMYISAAVTKFTLEYSYSHSATDGHLVKSRAQVNYILYNRLSGEDGTDSYELSLPNAGTTYVIGNLIEQGPNTGNPIIVDYGSEGASNPGSDLYVVNNTIVNDASSGTFVSVSNTATPAVIENNVFAGPGTPSSQANPTLSHDFTGDPGFVDRAGFDYHLKVGSPCIDAGVTPGTGKAGFSLVPTMQYVHPTGSIARGAVGALDIGAYEFDNAPTDAGSPQNTGGTTASAGGGAGGAPVRGSGGLMGGGTSAVAVPDGGVSGKANARDSGGCGCRTQTRPTKEWPALTGALAAMAAVRRRRRKYFA